MAAAPEELDGFHDALVPLLAQAVLDREGLVDTYLALCEVAAKNEAHAKLAKAREHIDYTLLKNKGKGFRIEHLHATLWKIRATDASEDHKKRAIRFLLDYIPPEVRAVYDKTSVPAAPVAVAAAPIAGGAAVAQPVRAFLGRLRSVSSSSLLLPSSSGK